MAALNPDFTTQQSLPLPAIFGYSQGQGSPIVYVIDPAGNVYAGFAVAEGEIDGIVRSQGQGVVPSAGFLGYGLALLTQLNVHNGRWAPIGAPLIPAGIGGLGGLGGSNSVDECYSGIPAITPPQFLSGIANFFIKMSAPTGYHRGTYTAPSSITPTSIFKGMRCRYFDASGNVTGYGFTTNPAWHIMEALLRWQFKVEQPQIAGLTPPEIALFNFASIAAYAARNQYAVFTGAPRFMGNYVFASDGSLTNVLETMLRCSRGYLDDPDGQIGMYGHDNTNSGFLLTANHAIAGTFECGEDGVLTAPNIFVPKYRDLNVAAVAHVNTITGTNGGYSQGSASVPAGPNAAIIDTGGVNPFSFANWVLLARTSNAAIDGMWFCTANPDPTVSDPVIIGTYGPSTAPTTFAESGGYVGGALAVFEDLAPTSVQHRQHQKLIGQIAPGVAGVPIKNRVEYDLGNMTGDQANRLMKYYLNTTLGPDVPGWLPLRKGRVSVQLHAVDAAGNLFLRMRPGEGDRGDGCGMGRFTVDDTLSPEFAGEFFISEMDIEFPQGDSAGQIDIEFQAFVGAVGYPDASYTDDLPTYPLASPLLSELGTDQQLIKVAWTLQATSTATENGDGTVNIAIPDLLLHILGEVTPRNLASTNPLWTAVPEATVVLLYVNLVAGSAPQFLWVATPLTTTGASIDALYASYQSAAQVQGLGVIPQIAPTYYPVMTGQYISGTGWMML